MGHRLLRVLLSLAVVAAVTWAGFNVVPVNATSIGFAYLLVVLFAAFNFVDNLSNGEPMVPLPALALALIIWLIGLGCRYVSLARRAERIRHRTKQA